MKRIEYLTRVLELFEFRMIMDESNNEYIVFENSTLNELGYISDRTEFEALENHVHMIKNIKPREFKQLSSPAAQLGKLLLFHLNNKYPNRRFVVYVTLQVYGDMIIRFHQRWDNEELYYNVNDFHTTNEMILQFETKTS